MFREVRVLGVVLVLSLCSCVETKFEQLVDIPSKFVLTNFAYSLVSPLRIRGRFWSGSVNNGTACAYVHGKIDWGDGVIEDIAYIPPCIPQTDYRQQYKPNWTNNPDLYHTYPAAGTYSMKADLTAEFTNGWVTAKLEKEIVVSQ